MELEKKLQDKIQIITHLKEVSTHVESELRDSFDCEQKNRQEFFKSILKLVDKQFDEQNRKVQDYITTCKTHLDNL